MGGNKVKSYVRKPPRTGRVTRRVIDHEHKKRDVRVLWTQTLNMSLGSAIEVPKCARNWNSLKDRATEHLTFWACNCGGSVPGRADELRGEVVLMIECPPARILRLRITHLYEGVYARAARPRYKLNKTDWSS